MFRRHLGFALIVASAWTNTNRCVLAQATPPANSKATVTFALFPLGLHAHLPVEVEGLVLDDDPVQFDEPLSLPANWPAHLRLRLRNVSAKPITYVMFNFSFPESGPGNDPPYPFGNQIHLGNLIPAKVTNQRGEWVTRKQVSPLTWLPDTEITLPLMELTDTLAAAEHVHQPISRVEVNSFNAQFNDVSRYNGSEYYHCQQDGSHCVEASFRDFVQR